MGSHGNLRNANRDRSGRSMNVMLFGGFPSSVGARLPLIRLLLFPSCIATMIFVPAFVSFKGAFVASAFFNPYRGPPQP
jgi:hypothetical protein